jgi:CPA1 family monovalent cation:H+ antiporter
VVVVRIAFQFLPPALGRLVPALGDTGGGENWRERLLIGWSGMRGAVSLAAALALPFTLDSGAGFDSRDLIVYLTVAVIFVTLVGQGLSLPSLVRWLGLSSSGPWLPDEAVARMAGAQAALDRLEELESEGTPVPENAVSRLRELYQARFARSLAALSGDRADVPVEDPLTGYRRLREDLIAIERRMLLEMRNDGRIKQDLFRRIQRDLDLDEARLRT